MFAKFVRDTRGGDLLAAIIPDRLDGHIAPAGRPVSTIRFDGQVIQLDAPLVRFQYDISGPAATAARFHEITCRGATFNLTQHLEVDASAVRVDSLKKDDVYIRVGNWEHVFRENVEEVTVITVPDAHPPYEFIAYVKEYSFFVDPNTSALGLWHRFYELEGNEGLENYYRQVTAALVSAGYPKSSVRAGLLAANAEHIKMSDRDFLLQALASDGNTLSKEGDLQAVLRQVDFQEFKRKMVWAFLTTIHGQEMLVMKTVPDTYGGYRVRHFISVFNAQGKETAWCGLHFNREATPQEVADKLASLLGNFTKPL